MRITARRQFTFTVSFLYLPQKFHLFGCGVAAPYLDCVILVGLSCYLLLSSRL